MESILAPDIGQRLKAARERIGRTPNQIIAYTGLTVDAYLDLEAGHDWFQSVALKEICSLAQTVELTTSELLTGRANDPTRLITLEQLRDKLIEWLDFSNLTLGAFETQIGWEAKAFVKDIGAARDWNIDCLRTVCEPIGADWTQVSFCQKEPRKPPLKPMSPGAIFRDVGIIWGLTLAGGFVMGISGLRRLDQRACTIASGDSNTLLLFVGFVIIGCLIGRGRWKHLLAVTLILWITNLANILLGMTLSHWLVSLPFLLAMMGIGGAISYLFQN